MPPPPRKKSRLAQSSLLKSFAAAGPSKLPSTTAPPDSSLGTLSSLSQTETESVQLPQLSSADSDTRMQNKENQPVESTIVANGKLMPKLK